MNIESLAITELPSFPSMEPAQPIEMISPEYMRSFVSQFENRIADLESQNTQMLNAEFANLQKITELQTIAHDCAHRLSEMLAEPIKLDDLVREATFVSGILERV